MESQETTPDFTNFDEDSGRINLAVFRKHYKIPAADIRAICKELGLEIIRDGAEQYIVGENPYNVSNSYYLKHAVYEYRKTMYVTKTKLGDFQEYEIDLGERGSIHYGVHNIEEEDVKPKAPSIRTEPNKQSPKILVPVNRGAELMMRRASVPTTTPTPAPAPGDALQVLVAALTEAQKAAQAPDALHPQKTLLEAEEHGFLITTEQLGQVLGMSKGTITSKKSGFRKLGFEFEKVKEGSTTLWKVKRY
jgi:biotin operon repressor